MLTTPKVRQFVSEIIDEYGYQHYEDLSYCDKCEFVALLIEEAGRFHEYEFITESNHFDQVINIFKRSLRGTEKDDKYFMAMMKENAIQYYEDTMTKIFDEVRCHLHAFYESQYDEYRENENERLYYG